MHRIQIQLTAQQERQLRDLAKLRNASISALIREGVDRLIGPQTQELEARRKRAKSVVGKYRSRVSDIAEQHDRYLAEDIEKRKGSKRS